MWSYGSLIYNYLCNQYISPLTLWVWTLFMASCTWYNIMWLATGWWFSPVSSTNKTDSHNITEILLKIALNTINQPKINKHLYSKYKLYFNSFQVTLEHYNVHNMWYTINTFIHVYSCNLVVYITTYLTCLV